MVDLMPTMHCLTALDDVPPFVLTLADVELAHFERVAVRFVCCVCAACAFRVCCVCVREIQTTTHRFFYKMTL